MALNQPEGQPLKIHVKQPSAATLLQPQGPKCSTVLGTWAAGGF